MPSFYLSEESHTLASALRGELEALVGTEDFVACTLVHPLDDFLVVDAPSEAIVRAALLAVKERVAAARRVVGKGS
jgi:DNA-directed RNA polymerase subunit L